MTDSPESALPASADAFLVESFSLAVSACAAQLALPGKLPIRQMSAMARGTRNVCCLAIAF